MITRPQLTTILHWLDEHLLLLLSGFLIAFIPLYPKIPLFSPIEQYIVRVRWEDVLVFLTGVIWLIQLARKKVTWNFPGSKLILAYAVTGMLTMLTAMFVIQSIPLQPLHVGKSLLHYFRYLEYFSLFFILATSIKSKQHLQIILGVIASTLLAVSLYGIGQKYLYWPVYSTMNREFSKGLRLYLTEHARVQSTFAGHYDLGAYLVIILPLILGTFFVLKKPFLKIALALIFFLGIWLLTVSASRTSFAAAMIGFTIVVVWQAWQKIKWLDRIKWAVSRLFVLNFLIGMIFLQFGDDIYERFLQVIDGNPVWHETYHSANAQRKEYTNQIYSFITGRPMGDNSDPLGLKNIKPPEGALGTDESGVLVSSDERPIPTKPSDVYVDVPDYVQVSTISATGEESTITVAQDRVFSECARKMGLSICIRLETLWPKAVAGFQLNPLFGKGYATLNKDGVEQFTEAESTDNNFLRTLGETGLIGFITFYGVIVVATLFLLKNYRKSDAFERALIGGFIAGTTGLLLNAVYIDVFAASKVAFAYWSLTGILVGYFYFVKQPTLQLNPKPTITTSGAAKTTKKKSAKNKRRP